MASIATEPNGFKRVIFKGLDGKRRPIRLGKCSEKFAILVADHVEEIINQALMPSRPLARATAEWLGSMCPKMEKKLVAVGLIHPREATQEITLGEFLDAYLARRSDVKAGTAVFYGHTKRNLIDVYGADRPLSSITPADADDFRRHLQTQATNSLPAKGAEKPTKKRTLAAATVARRCSLARTFFKDAVRRKLIAENPFDDVVGGPSHNPARQRFIDQATITKVLEFAPSIEWESLIAMSRFAGLRVPSEPCSMRWRDIDWAGNRMTVHSPKTEHHIGKGERVVPIFPELRPYLDELFVAATKGFEQTVSQDDWILPAFRHEAAESGDWRAVNLRTQFEKIIKRAGVSPWPRLWHNLRASRQTELEEHFPSHVVCAWLGNSEAVARKHYLQVREVDFQKAARIPARGTPECGDLEAHGVTTNAKTPGNPRVLAVKMGDTGFEPVTSTV
ncbi:MAG: tyrosine-type recombinase/integrase [Planctomycetaceae bacterium]